MHDTRDLTKRLAELLRREHGAMADFLVALAAFDHERRWVQLGYTSLFWFLHRELGVSKGAAFYRKTASELVQRYPEVLEPLRDGRLCLSSVVELAKVITPENCGEVVERFFHASRDEAKAIAAELRPAEVVPQRDVVTAVHVDASGPDGSTVEPLQGVTGCLSSCTVSARPPPPTRGGSASVPVSAPTPPPRTRDDAQPLTGELSRLHVTVSRRFLAKLAAAKDALSLSHPGACTEEVLEAALDLLLAADLKKKAVVAKPRAVPAKRSARPRHIPAHVKRTVWERDGGKCQWATASSICGSTSRVEFDHVVPIARGGASTVENLRLLCAFHNDLAARQVFGDAWIDRCSGRAKQAGAAGTG